ncbi:helix-turn-helix domain-containing protein, partial [Stenotrophomonas maltophilia]|uniref:helix-turn-helix domain-containing protein n=1 Tax=Stenotrophomonas maltophilia TaxID=40324 RepID=UPI0013DD074D
MEERIRMLSDYASGNWNVSELCQRYGVCRDTFYEWRRRQARAIRLGFSIARMLRSIVRIAPMQPW